MSAYFVKETGWIVKNNNLFLMTKEGAAKWANSIVYDDIAVFESEEEANKRIKRIKKGVAILLDQNTPRRIIYSIHKNFSGVDIDVFEVPSFCKKWSDGELFYEVDNVLLRAKSLRRKAIDEKRDEIEKLHQQILKLEAQTDEDVMDSIKQNLEHLEHVKKIHFENVAKKRKKTTK